MLRFCSVVISSIDLSPMVLLVAKAKPGEFKARPVITIEGHGGFEQSEGCPEHYAIDGQFGGDGMGPTQ